MGKTTKRKQKKLIVTLVSQIIRFWPTITIVLIWLLFSYPYIVFGRIPFPSDYLVDFFAPWNNYFGLPAKNNAMSDVINQIYPWKIITIDAWKSLEIPKWNPYQFSGTPHMANYQSALFSPINTLFFLVPFIEAWSIQVLLQPLLAGVFMMLYLREIRISKTGSAIGSITFMFGGYMTVWMAYATLGYALLFLPLILFAIERLSKTMSWKYILLVAMSIWLSLVSGHFQISFYVILFSGIYLIYKLILKKDIRLLFYGIIAFMTALVFASPQLSASYSLYAQSARSVAFGKGAAVPLSYLITLVAPDYLGNPVTRNDWFGLYAEFAVFAGSLSLFLGLFSLVTKYRLKFVGFFSLVAIVGLIFALDTKATDILVSLHIPFISTTYLSRILSIVTFCLAILSAFGVDALFSAFKNNKYKKTIVVYCGIWFALLSAIWIDLIVNKGIFISEVTNQTLSIAKSNMRLPTLILLIGISISVSTIIVAKKINNKVALYIVATVLVLLTFFDMYRYSSKWMPFESREHVYPSLALIEFLQENSENYRVLGHIANESLVPFDLYGVEGYDPLYIRRYGELMRSGVSGELLPAERSVAQFPDTGKYAMNLANLLGVKYFVHSIQDEQRSYVFPFWEHPESFQKPVWSDDTYEIYENSTAYDRAFVVHDYVVARADQEIIEKMYDPKISLRDTAILEKDPDLNFGSCIEPKSVATISYYSANEVRIAADASCDGLLILTDSYYPDWKAYMNGQEVEILRADYSFRAVPIKQGKSEVKFKI